MDFLFHKVSEKEKEDIRKQAKKIIDDFSRQLSKAKKDIDESMIERLQGERDEEMGQCEEMSREIMFKNAPEKNKDFIIAEKKKW